MDDAYFEESSSVDGQYDCLLSGSPWKGNYRLIILVL
jgi:hypothetical protein